MIELFDYLIIPVWAASYLENGDSSGLTEDESAILQQFQRDKLPAGAILDWSDLTSFYHFNDVTFQGADCHEVTVYAPAPFRFGGNK